MKEKQDILQENTFRDIYYLLSLLKSLSLLPLFESSLSAQVLELYKRQ